MDQLFSYLLKEAASCAKSVRARNVYPEKPAKPKMVVENTGVEEKKVKDSDRPEDDFQIRGKNVASFKSQIPFDNHLRHWNTISGTGYGRPYWDQKDNPWRA